MARETPPGAPGKPFYDRAFARRPGEELYDLRSDPEQTKNVAGLASLLVEQGEMARRLMKVLTETGDPRVTGDGLKFERPPFTDPEPGAARKSPGSDARPK